MKRAFSIRGVWFAKARLWAVAAAGLQLAGCATFVPFQSAGTVLVGVADKPEFYDARPVAAAYAKYAVIAARAYDNPGAEKNFGESEGEARKAIAGWRIEKSWTKFDCPRDRVCTFYGGLGVQLWVQRSQGICRAAVIAFRGTDLTSYDDWVANLHWFHSGVGIYDQYDQARDNISVIVREAERRGCTGKIVAVGHSLGGGLAQHVAYAHAKIRTVYAFDPSFVVGIGDIAPELLARNRKDRYFDYVYEQFEILAFPRAIVRLFHPYSACNPRIRTVRFNTLSGTGFSRHRIEDLAKTMVQLSRQPAPPSREATFGAPRATKPFNLNAKCPAPI